MPSSVHAIADVRRPKRMPVRLVPVGSIAVQLALWKKINRTRSKVRAHGEHAFHVVKRLWGFEKVRYRGLAKNTPGPTPRLRWQTYTSREENCCLSGRSVSSSAYDLVRCRANHIIVQRGTERPDHPEILRRPGFRRRHDDSRCGGARSETD